MLIITLQESQKEKETGVPVRPVVCDDFRRIRYVITTMIVNMTQRGPLNLQMGPYQLQYLPASCHVMYPDAQSVNDAVTVPLWVSIVTFCTMHMSPMRYV